MKKVLFAATVDSHILQFHLPFLKLFKDHGYEVHVATNGNEEIPYCDVKHVISFERSPFKFNNIKAIKQLKKIVNQEHFDIIHCHTPMGSVVTRLAAKKARKNGTRVIYTAHGLHFFKGAPIKNWLLFYPVEKYLSKYTDTLILINKEDYELCKKKFKKCKDIQYVPGVGVDENKFNFKMSENEKLKLRKSLGLKKDDFVMIYPAELNKNKNQLLLINVVEKLSKRNVKVKLILPGKDSYKGFYQNIVQKKKLEDNILFLGYRNDVSKLLAISNLAVASSLREGLPVNIMEALYIGLPVIATNCRGHRDLIYDGLNGYLVPINDVEKFTTIIENIYKKELILNNEEIHEINNFTLTSVKGIMQKIYFKKKKILHLLSSNSFSGAENVVSTIIEKNNSDFDFIYCSPYGPIENTLKAKKINYYGLKKLSIKYLQKAVTNINPDIIHAHDFKASILASIYSNKIRIISHIHKNDPEMKKISIKSISYLLVSTHFYKIVCVSNSIIKEFIFKKFITNKFLILHNYVDREKIIKLANATTLNQKYDLYFLGRLVKEKNPLMFIEIIKELNCPHIKSLMIGDGPLYKMCQNTIKKYGLTQNIKMIGFKSNPYPYIKASKIGILPSIYEGFGLAAIEGIILDKIVLNSGVGGLAEIFKRNKEYICNSKKDYLDFIKNYNKNTNLKVVDINKYCDIKLWKQILNKCYL